MRTRIDRRDFLKMSASGITAASLAATAGAQAPKPDRPNLVFVFPDQMRGQALGFLGEEPVITPNLDAFARQSLVLPDCVSNYPVCSPYRAILMTGKWPHANGVTSNCTSETAKFDCELRASDRCWSDVLADAGYSLGYIGKWHLEGPHEPWIPCKNNEGALKWNEWTPPERRHGFGFWYAYNTYDYHTRPMYWGNDAPRDGFHFVDQWGPEHEADMAIRFIRNEGGALRDSARPFALVVSMNPPHMPYNLVPDKYVERYKDVADEELFSRPNIPPAGEKMGDYYRRHIRNYYAMITGVDEQFGRILDALAEQGLAGNTIVVFTSDHGDCLGIHDMQSKNNRYEESMRVPFIVRWPGRIPPRHDDLMISTPDIYPTLLDLMGLGSQVPEAVQGVSRAQVFLTGQGERPDSQVYIWMPHEDPSGGRRGIRTRRHTLELTRKNGRVVQTVLYDNEADPWQMTDVSKQQPEIVAQLTARLTDQLARNGDPWVNGGGSAQG